MNRVHIFGASGSGTTTLGLRLSERLECRHFDTDTYFWIRTNPPFRTIRALKERQERLRRDLANTDTWVLSGSLCGWGDFAIPLFNLAVFLAVPAEIRLRRLKQREILRYGPEIDDPDDPRYETHNAFLRWAADYDSGGPEMRSRAMHEEWMNGLACPVLRIEGTESAEINLKLVLENIIVRET